MLSPRIWIRNAPPDDYHISYFEIMQPVCGHRNFRPPKIFDPPGLLTRGGYQWYTPTSIDVTNFIFFVIHYFVWYRNNTGSPSPSSTVEHGSSVGWRHKNTNIPQDRRSNYKLYWNFFNVIHLVCRGRGSLDMGFSSGPQELMCHIMYLQRDYINYCTKLFIAQNVNSVSKETHHEFFGFPCDPGSRSNDPAGVIFVYENLKNYYPFTGLPRSWKSYGISGIFKFSGISGKVMQFWLKLGRVMEKSWNF